MYSRLLWRRFYIYRIATSQEVISSELLCAADLTLTVVVRLALDLSAFLCKLFSFQIPQDIESSKFAVD